MFADDDFADFEEELKSMKEPLPSPFVPLAQTAPVKKTEQRAPVVNPDRFVKDDKREVSIASADETFDDFKEFLDSDD